MKILDLPEVTSVNNDQVMIVDGGGLPTSKIKVSNLNVGSSGEGGGNIIANPENRWIYNRNTYRGNFLGTIYTDEQKAAVSSGTFDDLYVGDYWTIGNFDWVIADINYWLGKGDVECTTPHLVITPKTFLYEAAINDTTTANGGYVGSKLYTQNLNNAKTIIYTAFGENNILDHREFFSNDNSINGIWINSKVDIMNLIELVGSTLYPNKVPTIDTMQFALYRLNPKLILDSNNYWLRDVVSTNHFCFVVKDGRINEGDPKAALGIRPAFGLTG